MTFLTKILTTIAVLVGMSACSHYPYSSNHYYSSSRTATVPYRSGYIIERNYYGTVPQYYPLYPIQRYYGYPYQPPYHYGYDGYHHDDHDDHDHDHDSHHEHDDHRSDWHSNGQSGGFSGAYPNNLNQVGPPAPMVKPGLVPGLKPTPPSIPQPHWQKPGQYKPSQPNNYQNYGPSLPGAGSDSKPKMGPYPNKNWQQPALPKPNGQPPFKSKQDGDGKKTYKWQGSRDH